MQIVIYFSRNISSTVHTWSPLAKRLQNCFLLQLYLLIHGSISKRALWVHIIALNVGCLWVDLLPRPLYLLGIPTISSGSLMHHHYSWLLGHANTFLWSGLDLLYCVILNRRTFINQYGAVNRVSLPHFQDWGRIHRLPFHWFRLLPKGFRFVRRRIEYNLVFPSRIGSRFKAFRWIQ